MSSRPFLKENESVHFNLRLVTENNGNGHTTRNVFFQRIYS